MIDGDPDSRQLVGNYRLFLPADNGGRPFIATSFRLKKPTRHRKTPIALKVNNQLSSVRMGCREVLLNEFDVIEEFLKCVVGIWERW